MGREKLLRVKEIRLPLASYDLFAHSCHDVDEEKDNG